MRARPHGVPLRVLAGQGLRGRGPVRAVRVGGCWGSVPAALLCSWAGGAKGERRVCTRHGLPVAPACVASVALAGRLPGSLGITWERVCPRERTLSVCRLVPYLGLLPAHHRPADQPRGANPHTATVRAGAVREAASHRGGAGPHAGRGAEEARGRPQQDPVAWLQGGVGRARGWLQRRSASRTSGTEGRTCNCNQDGAAPSEARAGRGAADHQPGARRQRDGAEGHGGQLPPAAVPGCWGEEEAGGPASGALGLDMRRQHGAGAGACVSI